MVDALPQKKLKKTGGRVRGELKTHGFLGDLTTKPAGMAKYSCPVRAKLASANKGTSLWSKEV